MDIVQKTQKKIESSKKKLSKTIALKSYKKLAINFLILTANLIIILLYFSLSQAKILIVPVKTEIENIAEIKIKNSNDAMGEDGSDELSVNGEIITVQTEHSQEFQTYSTSKVEKNARGKIIIHNTTPDKNQTLVKETRFQNSEGIEIKIERTIQIKPGEKITVEAYASEKGKKGEVKSEDGRFQVVALPYLKDKIYAEISEDFKNGLAEIKIMTPEEFSKARKVVEEEMKKKAIETLSKSSPGKIKEEGVSVEISEFSSTAQPGEENIETFKINAKGMASAFYYDEKTAEEIAKQELIKQIPPDKIFVEFTDGSFNAQINKEKMELRAIVKAKVQTKIPQSVLSQKEIMGMNKDEVHEYFTKITGIRDVEIKFWPFWVKSVPNMESHIDIEIKK